MRAGWADSVSRAIESIKPVQVPGMLVSRGFHGTKYTPMAAAEDIPDVPTAATVQPFDVRWYRYESDDDDNGGGGSNDKGQWQIYLPLGCLTVKQGNVTYFYVPTNNRAKDEDNKEIAEWYEIPEPENTAYANVVTTKDRVVTTYAVYLNMKPWPRVKISTDPTDGEPVQWQEAVATIKIVQYTDESDTPPERSATRLADETSIAKEWDISGEFAIKYEIANRSLQDKNAKPTVKLINQSRFIGRLEKTITQDTTIQDEWESVWIKIKHDSEEFEMTIEHDLSGSETVSDDDKTVYKIYDIEEKIVKVDYRDSVPEMDFYISSAS